MTTLLTKLEDHIFTITINRPDKMNALNRELMRELSAAIEEIYKNNQIKGAIITGAGEKAFVAGADISEFLQLDENGGVGLARNGHETVFNKIEQCPKPIIAAVNGYAIGGGCELAMACHMRIASENARFGQPEANLGLIPGYGGTQRLTQLVGKGKALELMMTTDMVTAAEALLLGLVNYVVALQELLEKCRELLLKIQTKAPRAIAGIVECVNAYYDHEQNGFDAEIETFGECFATKDLKEGASAFLEKRKPLFKGE